MWACDDCKIWYLGTITVSFTENNCPKCGKLPDRRYDPHPESEDTKNLNYREIKKGGRG